MKTILPNLRIPNVQPQHLLPPNFQTPSHQTPQPSQYYPPSSPAYIPPPCPLPTPLLLTVLHIYLLTHSSRPSCCPCYHIPIHVRQKLTGLAFPKPLVPASVPHVQADEMLAELVEEVWDEESAGGLWGEGRGLSDRDAG